MIEKDIDVRQQSIALINHVVPLIIVLSLSVCVCVFVVGHGSSKMNEEEESEYFCCMCSEPIAGFGYGFFVWLKDGKHLASAIRRAH